MAIPLLVVLLAVGGPASASDAARPATGPQTVPGEIVVGFKADVSKAERGNVLRSVGAADRRSFGKINAALAHVQPDAVGATLEKLQDDRRVRYAEPNFVVQADAVPNDPGFTNLWGLDNVGQVIAGSPGSPDADIDAPEAWNVTTGSPNVTVAVIDTGVDWSHPDLSSQIWINPGENCSGCRSDGIDNDHNGFVDDWHGWDFANNDNNPSDDHGHGTHVAGTIGAAGNNGVGVAGVNWNVRIMPVKFLNAQGSGTTADAVSAVLYAAQNGADVMNSSWGGSDYSQALADAITVADQDNSLFVAAAGNNGTDNDATPTYPASYDIPNVVSVAATDNTDNRAYFSNFGSESVDLGAPGVSIYSTWPGAGYQYLSGTSMAAPHVAGAAALAKAAFPSATAVGLKALLLDSVDPDPALAGVTASGGRLNIRTAVACNATPQAWIDSPGPGFAVDAGTPISLSVIGTTCASSGGVTVTATANGASIPLTARGDGLYTGTYTPTDRGPVTLSATATGAGGSTTRTVTGTARQAYPISPGGPPVTVTAASAGDTAVLRFTGTAGERVSLLLSSVTISSSSVTLLGPTGTLATIFAGTSGAFMDATALPVAGDYTIVVDPNGAATGSMTLTLYDVPPDIGGAISAGGSSTTVSMSVPGQNAAVGFSGGVGQRISLQLSAATVSAIVSIRKPDGTTLVSNRYLSSSGLFIDATALPVAGTYSIVVDPQRAATGSVTLTLYDVPPDAGGSITPGGASASVTTTVPGQNAKLTFTGAAGERVSLKIGSGSFSTATASILGPDGKLVGASSSFGTGGVFVDARTLPGSGTYALVVDPSGASVGSATLTLYDVPPDVSGTLAPGGPPAAIDISAPGQNARFTFDGLAGQRISLQAGQSSISQGYITVTRPDGTALVTKTYFTASGTFIDTRTLPTSGTYLISVDPQSGATGSVTLSLYDVPDDAGGSITIGAAALRVSVAVPGQNARLTFAGAAGQAITLKLTAVTISTSHVSIVKPDGTALLSNVFVSTLGRTINATLSSGGTYTIVVDPQGAATGSMTVALS